MKRLLCCAALLSVVAFSKAQNIQSSVVATGGESKTVTAKNTKTYTFNFTIGENAIGTYSLLNHFIVRGFQQGYDSVDYYKAPTYVWADDYSSVTGTAVSTTNSNNKFEKTVSTTYLIVTQPTCLGAGLGRYTSASFNSQLFEIQEMDIDLDALDHSWGEGVVTTEPTCSAKGVMTYTCTRDASHKRTEDIAIDANAHAWGAWTVTEAAGPDKVGKEKRVCSHNDAHFEERVIPMTTHVHSLEHIAAKPATCTEDSVVEHWHCTADPTYCNRYFIDANAQTAVSQAELTVLNTKGHKWNDGAVTTAATCETEGVKTFTCQRDASHTKTEAIAALGHKWDRGVPTTPATCTQPGIKTFTCENDNSHTYTEAIPAFGHNYPEFGDTIRLATCTIDGEIKFVCKNDRNHYYSEAIPAIGHDYPAEGQGIATAATCLDSAYMTYICRNDASHWYKVATGAPLGHDWSDTIITPATCLTAGDTTITCSRDASHKMVKKIPALGHNWNDGTIILAATCSATGTKVRVCLNDLEHTDTVAVPINPNAHEWGEWEDLGNGKMQRVCVHNSAHKQVLDIPEEGHVHDLALVTGVAPTCLTDGTIDYYHCSSCGRDYTDAEGTTEVKKYVAPATNHRWDEGTDVIAATCETAGEKHQTCLNDPSHTQIIRVAPLGHKWNEGEVAVAATCETAGEMLYTCLNNANHKRREVIDALGHDYDTVLVAATCLTAGSETITCKHDASHTSTKVIPALGHDWGEWEIQVEATATNPGIEKRICKNDNTHVETRTYEVPGEDGTTPMQGWTTYIGTNGDVNLEEQQEGNCVQITIGGENGEPGSAEFVSPILTGLEGQYYDHDSLVPISITFDAMFIPTGSDSTTTISVFTGFGLENQIGNLQIVDKDGNPINFESVVVDSNWHTYTLTGFIGPEGDSIRLQFVTGTTLGELLLGNISISIDEKEVEKFFEYTPFDDSGNQGGEGGEGQGGEGGEGQGGEGGEGQGGEGQGGEGQGGEGGNPGGDPNAIAEQNVNTDIRVYPNPAAAKLFVELPMDNASGVVKCFDNTGRLIMEEEFENTDKVELDVSGLPQGSYTLRIMLEETVTTKQVLKY